MTGFMLLPTRCCCFVIVLLWCCVVLLSGVPYPDGGCTRFGYDDIVNPLYFISFLTDITKNPSHDGSLKPKKTAYQKKKVDLFKENKNASFQRLSELLPEGK